MPDLNPKQQQFVAEYLIDLNATQAAIRAGYSPKTAEVQGSRLLSNAKIADAVRAAQAIRSERVEITQDYVLGMLRDNLQRAMQAEEVRDSTGRLTGVYRYEGSVANRAAELLGKHLGMFTDRLQVTTNPDDAANELASLLGVPAAALVAMKQRPST